MGDNLGPKGLSARQELTRPAAVSVVLRIRRSPPGHGTPSRNRLNSAATRVCPSLTNRTQNPTHVATEGRSGFCPSGFSANCADRTYRRHHRSCEIEPISEVSDQPGFTAVITQ